MSDGQPIEVDADPLPPRQANNRNDRQNAQPIFELENPPIEWQFNIFLNRLSDNITDEEFLAIKDLFTGLIGKSVLAECRNVRDVFKVMRQRRYLKWDNLVYLQSMVYHLNRFDMLKMCVDFARTIPNVLHFYCPPNSPENGRSLMKFHIDGKDFSTYSKKDLDDLRLTISNVIFAPINTVTVAGIEPSSSMVVSFLVPTMYADILQGMLKDKVNMDEFIEIGIDVIDIHDETYNIRVSEVAGAELIPTEQQAKLVNVYQQLQSKTEMLEEREVECLQLSRKLKEIEERNLEDAAVLRTFQKTFTTVLPEPIPKLEFTPASLASQSALQEFKNGLRLIEKQGVEKTLVLSLLGSNTTIAVRRLRDAYKVQFQTLYLQMEELNSQVLPLILEVEKYRFLYSFDEAGLESKLANLHKIVVQQSVQVNLKYVRQHVIASEKVCSHLRQKERVKLKELYEWPTNDHMTIDVEQHPNRLIVAMHVKEVQRTLRIVDFVDFVIHRLGDVGRKDLVPKFLDWIKPTPTHSGNGKRASQPAQSDENDSPERKDASANYSSLSGQLSDIRNKVDIILSMMNSALNMANSNDPLLGNIYPLGRGKFPSFTPNVGAESEVN